MISEKILDVNRRIMNSCREAGSNPSDVTLIAVSKNRNTEEIREVILAGVTNLGENRVQEAILKFSDRRLAIGDKQIKWHMVGHLQSNKVRDAVKIFDLIHSVDSLPLAEEINRQAQKINKVQEILIEVKTSPEATKSGVALENALSLIEQVSKLNNIKLKGLMTIAPIVDLPEDARIYFSQLRGLRDKVFDMRYANCDMQYLSMGMTDDFEVAIEEGSNMVRIGRAIFD